jgi:hypothetical protein
LFRLQGRYPLVDRPFCLLPQRSTWFQVSWQSGPEFGGCSVCVESGFLLAPFILSCTHPPALPFLSASPLPSHPTLPPPPACLWIRLSRESRNAARFQAGCTSSQPALGLSSSFPPLQFQATQDWMLFILGYSSSPVVLAGLPSSKFPCTNSGLTSGCSVAALSLLFLRSACCSKLTLFFPFPQR